MEIAKIIGNNIKTARKVKGMTQKEIALILRMTQQQYSRFEIGKFELGYQQIYDICKILDVTPNELYDFD